MCKRASGGTAALNGSVRLRSVGSVLDLVSDLVKGVTNLAAGLAEPFLDVAGRLIRNAFVTHPVVVGRVAHRLLDIALESIHLAVELVLVHSDLLPVGA